MRARLPPPAVALAALGLVVLTNLPYLRAALEAPPGRRFVGFFYYIDDAYNYLSYAQQAEDGAFLFRNKMVPEDHPPALVNLEWWLVGRLSALLGGRPALAYRVFGALVTVALLLVVDRLLAGAGLDVRRRAAGLLLVFVGAGLGGLLLFAGVPGGRCLDLVTGLFPFIELLANPHFAAGTLLLLLALVALAEGRARAGVAWGTLLGLVRPYDVGLLIASRGLGVALTERPAAWPRALAPLFGLLPVLAYNYWFFLRDARFATYASATYVMPPLLDFLPALGPALALAAVTWRPPDAGTPARAAQTHLLAWTVAGIAVAVLRPVPFPLQFMAGLGLPVLTLAAVGLARRPAAATWAALAGLSTTAVAALVLVWSPSPRWHVPAERLEAARLLRTHCRPGDLALAPPDIGLYTAGLSACRVFVGHAAARGFAAREPLVRAFYGAADPASRAALLDHAAVTHVVLPGDPGAAPVAWLGEGTPFERVGRAGVGPGALSVYARRAARLPAGGR